MTLSAELSEVLKHQGAAVVGYGDMSGISNSKCCTGISVAIPIPVSILEEIKDGPTLSYNDMYYEWNERLNQIVRVGEAFLREQGYDAYAQTTDVVQIDEAWKTKIPHKTVATRAGLGWIGKSGLLVTPEYGSAVRISSILTNAPLECAQAIGESSCGRCIQCVENCPAKAIKGNLWNKETSRENLVDVKACKKKQIEIMKERTGIETDLCGKCFVVCPYTKRYIKKYGN